MEKLFNALEAPKHGVPHFSFVRKSNNALKLTNTQNSQDLGCYKSQKTNQRKSGRERKRERIHKYTRFGNCLLIGVTPVHYELMKQTLKVSLYKYTTFSQKNMLFLTLKNWLRAFIATSKHANSPDRSQYSSNQKCWNFRKWFSQPSKLHHSFNWLKNKCMNPMCVVWWRGPGTAVPALMVPNWIIFPNHVMNTANYYCTSSSWNHDEIMNH